MLILAPIVWAWDIKTDVYHFWCLAGNDPHAGEGNYRSSRGSFAHSTDIWASPWLQNFGSSRAYITVVTVVITFINQGSVDHTPEISSLNRLKWFSQPQNLCSSAGDQKLQSSFGGDVEREEPKKPTETGHPGSCDSTQLLSPVSLRVNDALSFKISGLKSQVFGCAHQFFIVLEAWLDKPMLFLQP